MFPNVSRPASCATGTGMNFCREKMSNVTWLDGALYPDVEVPDTLDTLADRVDFLARLCSAWDFGLLPDMETIAEIRRQDWREAVDACRLLTSPSYHLLRRWHGLSPLPYLGQQMALIRDDPCLSWV
jgi:hypothetical protein